VTLKHVSKKKQITLPNSDIWRWSYSGRLWSHWLK